MKKVLVAVLLVLFPGCATAPTPSQLAPAMVASTVALATEDGKVFCSGVAISPTRILTAAHCLGNPEVWVFSETDRKPKLTRIVWQDDARDVAVIETVSGANFIPARLGDSSTVQRGDQLFVVGNTYGYLEFSFVTGYVAHSLRDSPFGVFIQISAEIRGGNSGGPVYNANGELVGILTRGDNGGIAFAVPINDAKR